MNERQPLTEPTETTAHHVESADVWDRLRRRVEQLSAMGSADPAARARKLAERAEAYRARPVEEEDEASLHVLVFDKGAQRYAVHLEHVVEIQSLEQFSPVPAAPPFIPGVTPWRGAILALLDLGRLFGVAETGLADVHHCVVVQGGGRRIGLTARDIEEVRRIPERQVRPAPEFPGAADWIAGVYDSDCLILKVDRILQDPALVEWRREKFSST